MLRVLDLFCGAGGASDGYHNAGFDVTGLDLVNSRNYPYEFIQADALSVTPDFLRQFDLVHASPPCQHFSAGASRWGTNDQHPNLIPAVRRLIGRAGVPYVIENIVPARYWLTNPIMLCGTMFQLGVFRHRLFEANFHIIQPEHKRHQGRIGDGTYFTVTGHPGGSSKRDGWKGGTLANWKEAMGILRPITVREITEAIPPAYTEYIGEYFLENIAHDPTG